MIGGGWLLQGPAYNPSVSNPVIAGNINTLAQAALAVRPDVEVVIFGYDYVGLWEYCWRNPTSAYGLLWISWGNPSPGDFYDDLVDLETRKKAIADGNPRIHYINNLGTEQFYHGHQTSGVPPGSIAAPTASNFPQGIVFGPLGRLGNDYRGQDGVVLWAASDDWIHLSDSAYRDLCVNATTQYFFGKFRGTPDIAGLTSQGSVFDGWIEGNGTIGLGTTGTSSGRMGDNSATNSFRTIYSFDTQSIPDSAVVTKASLYFCRMGQVGSPGFVNPFQGSQGLPRLDMKSGAFGTVASLENADYSATADANNVGCYTGSATGNGYFVRIDITAGGLSAFNTTGVTQFRLYFPSTDPGQDYINFFDGDASGADVLKKPFLDIWYTLPTPSPTPGPTTTPTVSPTASPTSSPSASPSPTFSPTPSPSGSPTVSPSPTPSGSPTPSPTPNRVRDWTVFE